MSGRLSVVATPIGCLEDITLRALRIMREADTILAEDTRHTKKLCAKYSIATPLRSFHAHSGEAKLTRVLDELREGAHFALLSDAGTPVVSDPGAELIALAAEAGIQVEAVPGPSAALAAVSVSGLQVDRFVFEGFLPRSGGARKDALERIAHSRMAVVLFESPHRIHRTLEELEERLGKERKGALCRELTKVHEQVLRGPIPELRRELSDPARGEITLVVSGGQDEPQTELHVDVAGRVQGWKADGLSTKDMVQRLRDETGWKKSRAYRAVLDCLGLGDDPQSP
jgi:16S rRNA (cytidine1402-2'-O)-methyltransferase